MFAFDWLTEHPRVPGRYECTYAAAVVERKREPDAKPRQILLMILQISTHLWDGLEIIHSTLVMTASIPGMWQY